MSSLVLSFSPLQRLRSAAIGLGTVTLLMSLLGTAQVALAGDYDRNVVMVRELGIGTMRVPIREAPIGVFVRGVARRHLRYFYLGTEAKLGYAFDQRPILQFGGAIGLETANDAWQPVRGYAEIGTGLFWAQSRLSEMLLFHFEGGARYILRSFQRPHINLHMGIRASSSLAVAGFSVVTGLAWSFD